MFNVCIVHEIENDCNNKDTFILFQVGDLRKTDLKSVGMIDEGLGSRQDVYVLRFECTEIHDEVSRIIQIMETVLD